MKEGTYRRDFSHTEFFEKLSTNPISFLTLCLLFCMGQRKFLSSLYMDIYAQFNIISEA